jgi:hypothetical protein
MDLQQVKKGLHMTNAVDSSSSLPEAQQGRLRFVQIQVQFVAETDDEALVVKKAVSEALLPFEKVGVTFAMTERPGGLPPSMRR